VKPDAYKLRLASSRTLYDYGTLVSSAADLARIAERGIGLHVNPTDLVRFGIAEGSLVRVTSTRAPLTMTAVGDPGVAKGGCWIRWSSGGPGAEELIDLSGPITDVSLETTE
jgi:anaerobic selenocysteine-containing dehydrogenase